MRDVFIRGGPLMWPLLLCSIVSLGLDILDTIITIAKDNSIFVRKQPVELSGLIEKVMEHADKKNGIPVFIRGDRRADIGIAIRVLDLLKSAGIKEVSFECIEEEQ